MRSASILTRLFGVVFTVSSLVFLNACGGSPGDSPSDVPDKEQPPINTDLPSENPPPPSDLDPQLLPEVATADRCDFTNPEYCLFPWPNNFFTAENDDTATGINLNLNIASMPSNTSGVPIDPTEWNRNDGFSAGQMMLARIPEMDWRQTAAVPITDIEASYDPNAPILLIDAETGERQLIWSEIDANITKTTTEAQEAAGEDPGPALIIRPAKNLEHGRRYIVALRYIRNEAGEILQPPPGFQVYRDNVASQLPQVNDRRAEFDQLFTELENADIDRVGLYLAWDFTVISQRNMTERVLHMRDQSLAGLGGESPTFTVHTEIYFPGDTGRAGVTAKRIRGQVTVPCYLDTPNCAPGGTMNYTPDTNGSNGDGLPDALGTANVPYVCSVPRATYRYAEDPSAATEFNLALMGNYGHGLLGTRDEGNTYGSDVRQMADENNIVFCMMDWAGMATGNQPDDPQNDPQKYDPAWDGAGGDLANIASLLAEVSQFPKLSDRAQQGFLNFIMLGKAMKHENGFCSHAAFQVGGECIMDTSSLFYDGNSQGGIMGGALVALSPDIEAAAFGVPGMNYSTLLRRSVDFDQYAVAMYNAYPPSLDQSFILSFMQNLWDRAETNGYVNFLRQGNTLPGSMQSRVLLHPAFGDHQVTSWSAEVEARSMEASVHCPSTVVGSKPQRGEKITSSPHPFVGNDPLDNDYRHPDDEPYFGMPCISYPFVGNALIPWDSGPQFDDQGEVRPSGYAPPPIDNTPPRPELGYGADPHSDPRNEISARNQKGAWLQSGGLLIDVCNGEPCSARGFDPTP